MTRALVLVTTVVVIVGLSLLCGPASALDNGLARTPQMGWNSWNHFACNINETVYRSTVDALVETGLAQLGYRYANLDDCWAWTRNANGTIGVDPTTFPSGIPALVDYAHAKGLLFGLYTDLGTETCAGRPGSLGYEAIDAITYARWNADYVKVDNCYSVTAPELRYPVMSQSLNESGRTIFFSMCEWGNDDPAFWAPVVGNSWRTTGDIKDYWSIMTNRVDLNEPLYPFAGPGGWNDPDMLEVGNGGMTTDEYQAHFSLWALMKAPLLIGCDITNMTNATQAILMNEEVIAWSQDGLGVQGRRVWSEGTPTIDWAQPLPSSAARHHSGHFHVSSREHLRTEAVGTAAIVSACVMEAPTQLFSIDATSGRITVAASDLCLDVDYCRNWTNGDHVSVYPCHTGGCANGSNELWRYDAVTLSVQTEMTGSPLCLEAVPYRADLTTHPSAALRNYYVQIRPCNTSLPAQRWTPNVTDGTLRNGVGADLGVAMCLGLFEDVVGGATEVWSGPLEGGALAVVLFNRGDTAASITASWANIGLSTTTSANVRDVVEHRELGTFSGSYTAVGVPPHASVSLKVTPL